MRFSKIEIFANFDQNRDFLHISTKIEIFCNNRICKFRPKSRCLEISTKMGIFSKISTKFAIFQNFENSDKFRPKRRFSGKFRINIEISTKISTKIKIFRKFRRKSRFLKMSQNFTQNQDFLLISTKFESFEKISRPKFRQRKDFSQVSTKIEIFANFDQHRDFRTFRPKSRFPQNLTKIEILYKFRP